MRLKANKSRRGFTLLELLVAMAILGILAVISLTSFGTVREKGRDSRRKQDIQSISKSLEMYYNDYGRYPGGSATGQILGCGAGGSAACNWGGVWQNSDSTLYMAQLPDDPRGHRYYYQSDSGGTYYRIFAYLENDDDVAAALTSGGLPGFYESTSCRNVGGSFQADSCNYVLMSSNISSTPPVIDAAE